MVDKQINTRESLYLRTHQDISTHQDIRTHQDISEARVASRKYQCKEKIDLITSSI
jgi:hypothetical protein